MKPFSCLILAAFAMMAQAPQINAQVALLDVGSVETLVVPPISNGPPDAGKRVKVRASEYRGTDVFHTLYLPADWKSDGPAVPIIFEYTGNYFPQSGSTGEPEDGALGYCLSGGKYIWVSLPYISSDGTDNAVTWWGDAQATINYAKVNVPKIVTEFGADPEAVFLCGFSRGAIGVNYLGLYDDEVATLWSAFISHDHFDGVRSWGKTTWGSPLKEYRAAAAERLKRIGNRPYLVSQNGAGYGSEEFIRSVLTNVDNFTFHTISAGEIFGRFPNEFVKAAHTDRWALQPSAYRTAAWSWMNSVIMPDSLRDTKAR